MTDSAHHPMHALGEIIRQWAHVAVLLLGGLSAWFNLAAKVEAIEQKHAAWRLEQSANMTKITAAIEREQAETRTLMIEIAKIAAVNEAIREELRRQSQRAERAERQGFAPAAREVP
jgi:hypothetical protein